MTNDAQQQKRLGTLLADDGWEQGMLASPEADRLVVESLERQGRADLADLVKRGEACAVAISQTCDIVCMNDSAEPYVEFAIGRLGQGAPNPADTFLKSFRRFAVALNDGRHVLFQPWNRCLVERASLSAVRPNTEVFIDPVGRRDFLAWLTTRYVRAAFPDEFNKRLKDAGAEGQIDQVLRRAALITEIFLLLRPRYQEIEDPAVPYECDVALLCRRDTYLDGVKRQELEETVLAFEHILLNVTGIEVGDVKLRGEHEFSRHEMGVYDRWQFDDVSYAQDYRGRKQKTPDEPHAYRQELILRKDKR